MAYTIRNTSGQVVAVVNDKEVNTNYSVALIGNQLVSYGEILQNNFIRLLECGSNSVPPTKPLKGQLWFDNVNSDLKTNVGDSTTPVYKSLQKINYGAPSILQQGETFYNTSRKEFMVHTEHGDITVGPTLNENYRVFGASVNTLNPTIVIGDAFHFEENTNVFFKIYTTVWVPASPAVTATWELKGSAMMYLSGDNVVTKITDPFSIETISMGDDAVSQELSVSVFKPASSNNSISLAYSGMRPVGYSYITTYRVEMFINNGKTYPLYGVKG